MCPDETPVTPSDNDISNAQVELQASHFGMILIRWPPLLVMSEVHRILVTIDPLLCII